MVLLTLQLALLRVASSCLSVTTSITSITSITTTTTHKNNAYHVTVAGASSAWASVCTTGLSVAM